MNIITNEVASPLPVISKKLTSFTDLKPVVIDIETTGLSPDRSFIYLIGVLSDSEDGTRVTQFLASSKEEECEMLLAFFDFIETFDIYLNYNGTSFDIPFINKRCKKLKINKHLDLRRSVDYLRLFRASYIKEMLPDLKLKTVEKLAGINREDKFSGKECIELYQQFSEKKDKTAGKFLLLHNFEDLSCFPALNSIVEKIDLHGILMKTGFPVKAGSVTYFVNGVKIGQPVTVKGEAESLDIDYEVYDDNYTLKANSLSGDFNLSIETYLVEEDCVSSTRIFYEIVRILKGNVE